MSVEEPFVLCVRVLCTVQLLCDYYLSPAHFSSLSRPGNQNIYGGFFSKLAKWERRGTEFSFVSSLSDLAQCCV